MVPNKTSLSRRIALLAAAAGVAALGLALHFLAPGDAAGLAGDALYAVLVYLVLAFLAPRAGLLWLAVAAFAFSAAVEFAQLTGVPARLAESFPVSRLVFGATFSALDLAAYAVGAAAVCAADVALSGRGRPWRASRSE